MTYKDVIEYSKKLNSGEVGISDLLRQFDAVVADEKAIKESLDKLTIPELTKYTAKDPRNKKADYVRKVYNNLLYTFYVKEGMISYSPFSGQTFAGEMAKAIKSQTQADIDKYLADRAERKAKREAALSDPQTIDDFRLFVQVKGTEALTPQLKARYDALIAKKTFDEQAQRDERQRTVQKADLEGASMTLKKTVHTKKGTDLWVVTLGARISTEAYRDLNSKAKRLGGWYSSYSSGGAVPGFQFTTEQAATQFMQLQEGSVVKPSAAETRAQTAAEKLHAMADRWEQEGREKLTRDRKDNTARRARMAQKAEDDAERMIMNAAVMRKVADALEKGQIKYLSKVTSWAQISDLMAIQREAMYSRWRTDNVPTSERVAEPEKDIEQVKFPFPWMWREEWAKTAEGIEKERGYSLLANRMKKVLRASTKEILYFTSPITVDDLKKILVSNYWAKERKYRTWEQDKVKTYDRLLAMGITNVQTLRTALRELAEIRKGVSALTPEEQKDRELKDAERKFIGRKESGFFPTPKELAADVVEKAKISAGMSILEPSAGIGHLADVIADEHPDVDIDVAEAFYDMRQLLEKKGYTVVGDDTLSLTGKQYDRIIMNPPFEKGADIQHVMYCFNLLKPGGRLVAIMADNKDGQGADKEAFRQFVEKYGYSEKNPEGSFKSAFRPTGVNTITVVLDMPDKKPAPEPTPDRLRLAKAKAAAAAARIRILKLKEQ